MVPECRETAQKQGQCLWLTTFKARRKEKILKIRRQAWPNIEFCVELRNKGEFSVNTSTARGGLKRISILYRMWG